MNFEPEITTVWSFPERGNWATHNPKYRGNFAPQIPRNIILKYSKEGDTILDPMVGSGTTLIECKLLDRQGIGVDINPEAIEITKENLKFDGKHNQIAVVGDVRNLDFIKNDSIDLVIIHPPYMNIIKYSEDIKGDLSLIYSPKKFCDELEKGVKELYRVLKDDGYCAVLIGDTRKNGHVVPLAYYVMERFMSNGFVLKEDIIKVQHNCQSTEYWKERAGEHNFYLIMHEHLFVFRKPKKGEDLSRFQ